MSISASVVTSGAVLLLVMFLGYAIYRRLTSDSQPGLALYFSARFLLNRKEYRYFDKVILPTEDETTQIDHILVSRFGVFIVETLDLKGTVRGEINDSSWTLKADGNSQDIPNPVLSNARHIEALERIFGLRPEMIFPLMVFPAATDFESETIENVISVRDYRNFIQAKTEPLLGQFEVQELVDKIDKYIAETVEEKYLALSRHLDREGMRKIQRKLKRARPLSPIYKYAVIAVLLILFLGAAKKTFFSTHEPSKSNEANELSDQQEQAQKREELNKVYRIQDSAGRTKFTNVATSTNAKLVDVEAEMKSSLSVEMVEDRVIVPVTIGNNGMEKHTSVVVDRSSSRTVLSREIAEFLQAEKVGVSRYRIGGRSIPMEMRKAAYIKIGSIIEDDFIFLAFTERNQLNRGILGLDFIDKHPFEIDERRKLLIWQ